MMKSYSAFEKSIVTTLPKFVQTDDMSQSNISSIFDAGTNFISKNNNTKLKNKMGFSDQVSGSLSEKQLKYFLKTKFENLCHNDNLALLEETKKAKEINEIQLRRLGLNYKNEKNNLKAKRIKRAELERLFDKQEIITNLSCEKEVLARARLFFIRKLNDSTQIRLDDLKAVNKDVAIAENKFLSINKYINKKKLLVNKNRSDMVALKKITTSNAAYLYSRMLHIKKDHKRIINQNEVDDNLSIKNGKYLLIPLLKAGQFRSFGTQLAYQIRRMMKGTSKSASPKTDTQARPVHVTQRFEV